MVHRRLREVPHQRPAKALGAQACWTVRLFVRRANVNWMLTLGATGDGRSHEGVDWARCAPAGVLVCGQGGSRGQNPSHSHSEHLSSHLGLSYTAGHQTGGVDISASCCSSLRTYLPFPLMLFHEQDALIKQSVSGTVAGWTEGSLDRDLGDGQFQHLPSGLC